MLRPHLSFLEGVIAEDLRTDQAKISVDVSGDEKPATGNERPGQGGDELGGHYSSPGVPALWPGIRKVQVIGGDGLGGDEHLHDAAGVGMQGADAWRPEPLDSGGQAPGLRARTLNAKKVG